MTQSLSSTFCSTSLLLSWVCLMVFFMMASNVRAQGGDTCAWNNQVFQRGESLGDSFVTRCGSAADFPCYCNPDLSPPIECNYCSFALQGGGLLCARNEEIVRFTDNKGVDQTCNCQVENGLDPSAECTVGFADVDDINNDTNDDNQDRNDNVIDNGNNTVTDDGNNGTNNSTNTNDALSCLVALPSGAEKIVPNGEYIYEGEKANLCGDDYPCLCNMGQVECPYCTFNTVDGDVVCARDNESVIFEAADFQIRSCVCQVDLNATDGSSFSSECTELTSAPSVPPTSEPTNDPLVVVDLDCEIKDGKGNIVVVEHGESFGPLVEGKCGFAEEWPSFCNKRSSATFSRNSLHDDVEYPYCIFEETYSGDTVCARDNEEVTFLDRNGFLLACRCREPDGYGRGGMTTCRDASQQTDFTWSPTGAPKDVNGGDDTLSSSSPTMKLIVVTTVTTIVSFLL